MPIMLDSRSPGNSQLVLGIGTSLGAANSATDARYISALTYALERGIRIIDTAPNYRAGRSERVTGRVLRNLSSNLKRDNLAIFSKVGFIADNNREHAVDTAESIIALGLAREDEIVKREHCLSAGYVRWRIQSSIEALQTPYLDILWIHNPETQLQQIAPQQLDERLREVMKVLEEFVSEGKIRAYGISAWSAFSCPPSSPYYLSLGRLIDMAESTIGLRHHFRAVMAPWNLWNTGFSEMNTQHDGRSWVSGIQRARQLGLDVYLYAPFAQGGHLISENGKPDGAKPSAYDFDQSLSRALTLPGVSGVIAGMLEPSHIDNNISISRQIKNSVNAFGERCQPLL